MGEDEGGGGQKEFGPPPLDPLPPGEGRFLGDNLLDINSQNLSCKNLTLNTEKLLRQIGGKNQ